MASRTLSCNANASGYKILDGPRLIPPGREGIALGSGGEAFRLSESALQVEEAEVRKAVREEQQENLDGDNLNELEEAAVACRMAGIRAAAKSGYAVDSHHQWTIRGKHDQHRRPAESRHAAATVYLLSCMPLIGFHRPASSVRFIFLGPTKVSQSYISSAVAQLCRVGSILHCR